jgi:alkylation response protein AidB-like acyl-CoA dehydrogenase
MEFHITEDQRRLQERCRSLAADFASRAAQHDRETSHPLENYAALCDAGLYALNTPTELGGAGVGLLGYSLAAEELAQGCASTALSFKMHLSIIGPLMESPLVSIGTKKRVAHMVGHDKKLIAGNYSEPTPPETHRLAVDRQAARARPDHAEADRLRTEIERLGWEVQDVADGFRLIPKAP